MAPVETTEKKAKKLFVFGLGYSATRAALAFHHTLGYTIAGTVRTPEAAALLAEKYPTHFHYAAHCSSDNNNKNNLFVFDGTQWSDSEPPLEQVLAGVTHIINSVPAGRKEGQEDPVLAALGKSFVQIVQPTLRWFAYLSTIGVYGETNGIAVDESAPVYSNVKRSQLRIAAEKLWLQSELPVHLFRIAGIYGPGRGTIAKVRSGTATRIHIPGRLFNRIHVDDIANILMASAEKPNPGAIYNVCDDEPAPADEVTAYACELLGVPVPPSQTWEEAEAVMSAMAKSFYAESKITKNDRIKQELGVRLTYPSYREGLLAQVLEEEAQKDPVVPLSTTSRSHLVLLVNIGSLRPEPYLDLRQIGMRVSRAVHMPVVPCSFRFSHRIDASKLHGLPAKSFEMEILGHLQKREDESTEIVVLPVFFGNSTTLTKFLPEVLHKCWSQVSMKVKAPLMVRVGRCLVDTENPDDNRIAQILQYRIQPLMPNPADNKEISVLVLDHGTPTAEVHHATELVGAQLRALLKDDVKMVGTACMERREGAEYEFNDPLLSVALDHYKITSGIVIVTLLFLSCGRHAGGGGDIEEILVEVKSAHPNVDIRVTEPLGTHELLAEILHDRFRRALGEELPTYTLMPQTSE